MRKSRVGLVLALFCGLAVGMAGCGTETATTTSTAITTPTTTSAAIATTTTATESATTSDFPITVKTLVLNYDPFVPSHGNARMHTISPMWHNPEELVTGYVSALNSASGGTVVYQVEKWVDIDGFWPFTDGFRYTADQYIAIYDDWVDSHGGDWSGYWGSPDWHAADTGSADYASILAENGVIDLVNNGNIDEVLLLGPPMCGYYESRMVGPTAIGCNSPPLIDSSINRDFIVMTVGWERGLGEALEDFGHRTESILNQIFSTTPHTLTGTNYWLEFTQHDLASPGQAACGNVHFAPNSESDYDWGNTRYVPSTCDDWLNFPGLTGATRSVNCTEWGNGDMAAHHVWWLSHIPKADGHDADGMLLNWWGYISRWFTGGFPVSESDDRDTTTTTTVPASGTSPEIIAMAKVISAEGREREIFLPRVLPAGWRLATDGEVQALGVGAYIRDVPAGSNPEMFPIFHSPGGHADSGYAVFFTQDGTEVVVFKVDELVDPPISRGEATGILLEGTEWETSRDGTGLLWWVDELSPPQKANIEIYSEPAGSVAMNAPLEFARVVQEVSVSFYALTREELESSLWHDFALSEATVEARQDAGDWTAAVVSSPDRGVLLLVFEWLGDGWQGVWQSDMWWEETDAMESLGVPRELIDWSCSDSPSRFLP